MSTGRKIQYLHLRRPGEKPEKVAFGQEIKSGGAGTIYSIKDNPELVVKIYHSDTLNKEGEVYREKLECMLANVPNVPDMRTGEGRIVQLAWPVATAYTLKGDFVGFAMPTIDLQRTTELEHALMEKQAKQNNLRHDLGARVLLAYNLAAVVRSIHAQGHAIVDLKPVNLKCYKEELFVAVLDCDGFFIKTSGKDGDAPQVTPEYLAPEFHGAPVKNPEHQDRFALAVIIFRLLNYNIHPFDGIPNQNENVPNEREARIKSGLYPFGITPHKKVRPTPGSVHETFPQELRKLFDLAFSTRPSLRPSSAEWAAALSKFADKSKKLLALCPSGHLQFSGMPCISCLREQILTGAGSTRQNAPQRQGSPLLSASGISLQPLFDSLPPNKQQLFKQYCNQESLFADAVVVVSQSKASISTVQRVLRIGYGSAAHLVELMERLGFVSDMQPDGTRTSFICLTSNGVCLLRNAASTKRTGQTSGGVTPVRTPSAYTAPAQPIAASSQSHTSAPPTQSLTPVPVPKTFTLGGKLLVFSLFLGIIWGSSRVFDSYLIKRTTPVAAQQSMQVQHAEPVTEVSSLTKFNNALDTGDLAAAEEALRSAYKEYSSNTVRLRYLLEPMAQASISLSGLYLNQGKHIDAKSILQVASDELSKQGVSLGAKENAVAQQVYALLSYVALEQSDYRGAIDFGKRALSGKPGVVDKSTQDAMDLARWSMAYGYLLDGQFDEFAMIVSKLDLSKLAKVELTSIQLILLASKSLKGDDSAAHEYRTLLKDIGQDEMDNAISRVKKKLKDGVVAEKIIGRIEMFASQHGEPWLGVKINAIDPRLIHSMGLADGQGVIVSEVEDAGPAAKAGITAGDILALIDGMPVGEKTIKDVLAGLPIGKVVQIGVIRGDTRKYFSVRLEQKL